MITLTDNASLKVKELLAQEGQDGLMLRVAVRPGGCSGFSYEISDQWERDRLLFSQRVKNQNADDVQKQILQKR